MNILISSKLVLVVLAFGILAISFLVVFYVFAWQEPAEEPPEGNVPTPLNVSATAQTKEGDLTIQGFLSTLKDFVVGIVTVKSDGSMSPELNADKLDDYHAADLLAQTAGGGVTCEVICNGSCPSPPAGWILSQSTGKSGGESQLGVAGRCTFQVVRPGAPWISMGIEVMCCYFRE